MKIGDREKLLSKLQAIFTICDRVATPELLQIYGSALKDKAGDLLWDVLDEFAYRGGKLPSPGEIVERYNVSARGKSDYSRHIKWSQMMDNFKSQSMSPQAESARREAMAAISKLFAI